MRAEWTPGSVTRIGTAVSIVGGVDRRQFARPDVGSGGNLSHAGRLGDRGKRAFSGLVVTDDHNAVEAGVAGRFDGLDSRQGVEELEPPPRHRRWRDRRPCISGDAGRRNAGGFHQPQDSGLVPEGSSFVRGSDQNVAVGTRARGQPLATRADSLPAAASARSSTRWTSIGRLPLRAPRETRRRLTRYAISAQRPSARGDGPRHAVRLGDDHPCGERLRPHDHARRPVGFPKDP